MTPSQFTAESLLRTYLSGRTMPKILRDAIVWAIEVRLAGGDTPTLDETLRTDIDNHAVEPPERPTVCTLLRPSGETEVPTHARSRPSHRAFGTSVY
ncbi:hypothetical protein FFI97_001150 [Variovorax sp. KBS0712]|uniref:hypothetical protein n=1 Tax=Variovorax sp. KBS0712 TaxID=2578111 RepID=UPI001117B8B0|nr:hypothetical protein [Variovorax sp. KBS0712]TSD58971.1 hypothetical protein FFI97_001150 [Variovorax sp. KBS0712]